MKILVTGATGFIGRNLVNSLVNRGDDVSIIIRPDSDVSILPSRLNSYIFDGSYERMDSILKKSRPEVVVHLASLFLSQHTSADIINLIRSNIEFGSILLEAMNNNDCKKLINTGTSWQHYQNEDFNPVNLYAATKQAFEDISKYYAEAYGFKILNLHLFDSYGPGDTRLKLLSLLKRMANDGSELDMSPGEQEILLIHVKDIVKGYLLAIEHLLTFEESENHTYSIGATGAIHSLKGLINLIESVTGKALKINWGMKEYRKREVLELWKDFIPVPGWQAEISLQNGLKDYLNND